MEVVNYGVGECGLINTNRTRRYQRDDEGKIQASHENYHDMEKEDPYIL